MISTEQIMKLYSFLTEWEAAWLKHLIEQFQDAYKYYTATTKMVKDLEDCMNICIREAKLLNLTKIRLILDPDNTDTVVVEVVFPDWEN